MTIVQVMHSHTIGGVERHVVDLSQELVARGHRVYLACPNRGWMWDAVQGTSITPVHVAMDGLLDLASVGRLTRLVRQSRADIVHSHMTRGTFYAVKAARRSHIPIIATAHATHTYKHYIGADRVLCVSRAAQQNLIRHEIPAEKLRVVHNGIRLPESFPDPAATASLRASWGVPEGGRVVGTLARLIPEKGLDILLEVARQWKMERPNVHFVLAGSGEAETELSLRGFVEKNGLAKTVHFLGMVENANEVLAAYDVLAAPSRRESFSLTLLEAMAMGTPVVASNVGGNPEMITNGFTGRLVEPDNPEALAAGITCTLESPETAGIIDEARRMVVSRFTLQRMVSDIEAQYRELGK